MAEQIKPKNNATLTDWIAVAAGAAGALMATLDVSITNSALPQIQGAVGATGTEGTWITTGYMMSEIVMIPLVAWLTKWLGLRNLLVMNATLFIFFSFLCGFSSSLLFLIAARVGQGFCGGAMIPTAQSIVRTRLPLHQLPVGMTAFGLTVIMGPLLGPVVGGWLTENANWSWCFFINGPICLVMLVMLLCGLPAEKIKSHEFVKADWLGIAGLALGLSTLIAILEEGQRENWFESTMICRLSVISVTGLLMIIMSQIYVEKPVLNLRLFRNKSFSSVIIIIFVTGIVLYGIAYLVPQFLSHIAGYNAEQSGGVLLLAGIPALLLMYILPRLVTKVDIRLIVIPGLVLFAISCFMDTSLSIQSSGDSFVISQLVRGTAQMLCMMPLNQAAMAAVTKEESGDAAGLYNMARNLGGAIGLALIGTFLDRREAFHNTVLRESVHASSPVAQSKFEALAGSSVGGDSHVISAAQLVKMIAQQSSVLAYNETYFVLMVSILLCIPMAFLLKRPQKK
ncbi:DHA2 family efflux MFS transporter permease subunit [Citrobacter sp. BDA59-3]|uniref:DHA2 family efflux MFS transporter permease subunit n=1 Tax=Citrobacter sp. BDA59-3 TaxID=2781952 RepID=UPI00187F47B0|nr:DHA2 family efflux MFS transporter permease subunit [Citrobacter sp. BDA59-3]QOV70844.1 DHA2 family efflux MFS transporter permease subunit [Citrobacter sp. BDA59-3]